MKHLQRNSERGIALLVALFALILIAAIGLGMMFSSDSELNVNNSYRQNQLAYYAARSGLEEARDRMRFTGAAGGISDVLPSVSIGQATDGTHPNPGVLYIIPPGNGIDPTDITSKYFDDELCHEIKDTTRVPNSPGTFNIKCPKSSQSLPQIAGWSVTKDSLSLGAGNGTVPYAWTRINMKLQESTSPWCVLGYGNCTPVTGADTLADQVCYDGSREFVLSQVTKPINVPGAVEGMSLPTEVAMAMNMYFGANGQGNSGHSSTSTTGTAASTSSSTTAGTTSATAGTTTGTTSATTGTTTGTTSATTTGTISATSTTGTTTGTTSATTTGTTSATTTGTTSATTTTGTTSATTTGTTSATTTGTTSATTTGTTSATTTGTTSATTTGTTSATTGITSTTTGTTTGGGSASCPGVYTPPAKPASYAAPACSSANGQPVYTLTTLAVSPGGARRMLQYEIAQILIPPVPSALTLAGPSPVTSWPNSNPYKVNGNDGCTAAGHVPINLPAIGTTTDVPVGGVPAATVASNAATAIAAAVPRPDHYTGVDACPANTPDVQNVINVAPSFNTVSGLNAIVQSVENSITTPTGPFTTDQSWTGTDVGGTSATSVTAVNANLTLTGSSQGYGILLVTGTLTMSGDYHWDGLILVVGQGQFILSGGGNGQINGAVVVANIGNSSYAHNPTDGNLLSAMGSPTINFAGGGGNGLQYNSCVSITDPANVTFKVLARREITY